MDVINYRQIEGVEEHNYSKDKVFRLMQISNGQAHLKETVRGNRTFISNMRKEYKNYNLVEIFQGDNRVQAYAVGGSYYLVVSND